MLVVSSTNDEFFMPDEDRQWWKQLKGEKHRIFVQNAEHSLATGIIEAIDSICAFSTAVIKNTERPKFSWILNRDSATIQVNEIIQHATKAKLR